MPRGRTLILALAACATVVAPAQAQTMDEAVRANLALAIKLCVDTRADQDAMIAGFTAAGFSYEPMAESNGTVWHRFFGPAGTMRAEILESQLPGSCDVHTNHLPPEVAAPFAQGLLTQLYGPGRFVLKAPFEGTCTVQDEPAGSGIPLSIVLSATDGTSGCPALGGTVISIFSAV